MSTYEPVLFPKMPKKSENQGINKIPLSDFFFRRTTKFFQNTYFRRIMQIALK